MRHYRRRSRSRSRGYHRYLSREIERVVYRREPPSPSIFQSGLNFLFYFFVVCLCALVMTSASAATKFIHRIEPALQKLYSATEKRLSPPAPVAPSYFQQVLQFAANALLNPSASITTFTNSVFATGSLLWIAQNGLRLSRHILNAKTPAAMASGIAEDITQSHEYFRWNDRLGPSSSPSPQKANAKGFNFDGGNLFTDPLPDMTIFQP